LGEHSGHIDCERRLSRSCAAERLINVTAFPRLTPAIVLVCLLGAAPVASAAPYFYVDWTLADPAAGTAQGTITLPDLSVVTVTFAAYQSDGITPSFFDFAQTAGGTNYWVPSTPYISAQVDNAPPDSDILALSGGTDNKYVVTLSEPIKDPIMAIVSLGNPQLAITYDFDSPFTIVSQGAGFWGNGPLTQLPGDILQGQEGHGTIQFIGTFSTFSWTAPTFEFWHGFTFGIRTTPRIEPDDPPVPEPASMLLLGMGLAAGVARRFRRS
jgi:hypothetical protein